MQKFKTYQVNYVHYIMVENDFEYQVTGNAKFPNFVFNRLIIANTRRIALVLPRQQSDDWLGMAAMRLSNKTCCQRKYK